MIYFDNAATTFYKPPQVIDCVLKSLNNPANANRGSHSLSVAATAKITEVRNKVARMVNLSDPLNVAFSQNCTSALNLAILGSVKRRGFHVVTSVHEHNSVLRPLFELRQRGIISLSVLAPDRENKLTAQAVQSAFNKDTRLVVLSHVSNVAGFVNDVASIGAMCRRAGVKLIVDAAQSAGYTDIDMQAMNIDLLAFPAHKGLHGIQGCGCLCFNEESKPKPIIFGGTGTQSNLLLQPKDSPECFEAGTLNTPAILALGAAIDWHAENEKNNHAQIELVANTVKEGLKEIPDVHIMSLKNPSGIVSFRIGDSSSDEISDILSEQYGIAVRSGLHCAPLCHKLLGTEKTGLVRVSVSGQNTLKEAYIFLNAIEHIAKNLRSR